MVLADSASIDRTREIAARYDVTILCLHADQRLTAAAGRSVGYAHTTAEAVLFLDGDMELIGGWLERAIDLLHARPDVAVVTGTLIERPLSATGRGRLGDDQAFELDHLVEVPHGGGAALYRRAVLEKVGTFCPYLYSDEEPELCIRIRHAGYRVMKLAHPIAYHYTQPQEAVSTIFARWRRNLYVGSGQSIRYHLVDRLLWPYLRERGFAFAPGFVFLAVIALCTWFTWHREWLGLGIVFLAVVLALAVDALRKRSLYQTIISLSKRAVFLESTIRGLFMRPLGAASHPIRYDVVKQTHAGEENSRLNYSQSTGTTVSCHMQRDNELAALEHHAHASVGLVPNRAQEDCR